MPADTILVTETGSTAHGTGLDGHEDQDETAVTMETPSEVFFRPRDGVMQRTQPNGVRSGPGDTDRQIYSLRKFVYLALAGNPSVLVVLWAPILHSTETGLALRDLASCFVGRHVIPKHRGYMRQQVLRLEGGKGTSGHGRRGSGHRDELIEAHGYDTKFAMHAARLGFQGIELVTTGRLELPIPGESGDWLRAVRRGEVPYQQWRERIHDLDASLGRLTDDPQYRAAPDRERVESWVMSAHLIHWGFAPTSFLVVNGELRGRFR